jgi:hypothetical protein
MMDPIGVQSVRRMSVRLPLWLRTALVICRAFECVISNGPNIRRDAQSGRVDATKV